MRRYFERVFSKETGIREEIEFPCRNCKTRLGYTNILWLFIGEVADFPDCFKGNLHNSLQFSECLFLSFVVLERCRSGRTELPAKQLTWETGSSGSNPDLSVFFPLA